MNNVLQFFQNIDRRVIYGVLAIALLISLWKGRPVDPIVLSSVQNVFDEIEQAPAGPGEGKIILLSTTFSASTLGESGNQARALLRHLMLSKKRFAIIALDPQGATLGNTIAQEVAAQYDYVYGEDWINFGYQPGVLAFYTSFPSNIPATIEKDANENKPLSSFKIMRGIKSIKDVALLTEVTASASIMDWIQYVQGRYGLKIGYACTGVMAAEAYPFLDSGQLFGMLPGLKGAADYEKLVDELETQRVASGEVKQHFDYTKMHALTITPARKLMFTQNTAHIVIILFILLGNVGLLLSRRQARKQSAKEAR